MKSTGSEKQQPIEHRKRALRTEEGKYNGFKYRDGSLVLIGRMAALDNLEPCLGSIGFYQTVKDNKDLWTLRHTSRMQQSMHITRVKDKKTSIWLIR